MGDAFNPYSHWLKRPPQRWKPTYYELLGIEPSVTDKDAIIAIGKKLYADVKGSPLAGREKEHKALLGEIEEAVRTFASNTRRKAYDEQLDPHVGELNADTRLLANVPTALAAPKAPKPMQGAVAASQAQPASPKSTFAMPPMAAPSALPASTQSGGVSPRPVAVAVKQAEPPAIAIRTKNAPKPLAVLTADRHRQERTRQNSVLIAFSLGGILLVGALGFVFRGEIRRAIASAPTPPGEDSQPPESVPALPTNVSSAKPSQDTSPANPGAEKITPPDLDSQPNTPPEPKPETNPEIQPEMKPETKPESPPETQPKPPSENMAPPKPIHFTAENAAQLKAHCEAVIAALKSGNAAAAAAEMELAEKLAEPPEAKAIVDRLATIAGPLRVFWGAFDESWRSLQVGDEIAVGASTRVKVSSINDTEIEIETAAGKRKQSKASLSTGLLLGLVRNKLDLAMPDGKLALAMFHLLDKSGNAEEGAKLLSELTTTGLSAENVKSIVDASYDFSAQITNAAPADGGLSDAPLPQDSPPKVAMADNAEDFVKKMRAALINRDFETAAQLGKEIEKLATAAKADPMLAAEAQLAVYGAHFWKFVDQGIASFQGAEEIEVDDEIVVVIEASRNKLVCRIRGKRYEYQLKTIPPALALAIVDLKVDKNSADYDLSRGALYFTQKEPLIEKAKAAWESAKAKGAKAAGVLLTLTP